MPYDVNARLFTDYALKHRFIYLPPGKKIGYEPDEVWDFPVGTIVIKTFAYPDNVSGPPKTALGERLIETRLFIHESDGWKPYTYQWNDAQTEAKRLDVGDTVPVSWVDKDGQTRSIQYEIPSQQQCFECHGGGTTTRLLGPRTGELNRDWDYGAGPENQIDHIASLGWLDKTPPPADQRITYPEPFNRSDAPGGPAPLAERARAYVQANCAHCHSPNGNVNYKKLYLDWDSTAVAPTAADGLSLGVCKHPTSGGCGGLQYDLVPGDAEESILVCRISAVSPPAPAADMMPPLGRTIEDKEGVALVSEWIDSMAPSMCGGR